MEANELRIGSIIQSGHFHHTGAVLAVFGPDVLLRDWTSGEEWQPEIDECTGVQITEKWLPKLGLPDDRSTMDLFNNYDVYFERIGNELYLRTDNGKKKIDYVHTAQNIFYSLKGKEMENILITSPSESV